MSYENQIYDMLVYAADHKQPCPTNQEIANRCGFASKGSPVRIMDALVKSKRINVERFQIERRVTILASGKQTILLHEPRPHWRDRPGHVPAPNPKRRGAKRVHVVQKSSAPPPIVPRDPCPRCGVRGDIGCAHQEAGNPIGGLRLC